MGVVELREAFNSVSMPHGFACDKATLAYKRANDSEWQILTFYGTGPDAKAFTVQADRARASDDLQTVARVTAQRLVDERSPKQ